MKKWIIALACILNTFVEGVMSFDKIYTLEREACIALLEKTSTQELWTHFLKGQAALFSGEERAWLAKQPAWREAKSVFEIGSGNGAYLASLATHFPDKQYRGIEKNSAFVAEAKERYQRANLHFAEGDAENLDGDLSCDLILFRLVLQHLGNPESALAQSGDLLPAGGHIAIIDSCDAAQQTSHLIPAINDTLEKVREKQEREGTGGNRRISLDIMHDIRRGKLSSLYEIVYSNLNEDEEIVDTVIHLSGAEKRDRYCNHGLMFLELLRRTYGISVDLAAGYDQLQAYREDEEAWNAPGFHFLILRKKN